MLNIEGGHGKRGGGSVCIYIRVYTFFLGKLGGYMESMVSFLANLLFMFLEVIGIVGVVCLIFGFLYGLLTDKFASGIW